MARTREVYAECLKLVPHKIFSFSRVWIMFGNFEIRQKDIAAARKVFGNAIGMTPKDKIFQAYIQLEWQLGSIFIYFCLLRFFLFLLSVTLLDFDRCRKLYEKYLEWAPANCEAWTRFAQLEKDLAEVERYKKK